MPLIMAEAGANVTIKKVGGNAEVKKHLENLGFVPGSSISVISELSGNYIVKVKEARVAISREMAQKILI